MTLISRSLSGILLASAACLALAGGCTRPAEQPEPIAYVGHGAMFDREGRQIVPTAEFIAKAQAWYRKKLLAEIGDNRRSEFDRFERELKDGLELDGQAELVVEQRALDWLRANAPKAREDERLGSKLSALRYQLTWNLPAESAGRPGLWDGGQFQLDPQIKRKLDLPRFKPGGGIVFLSTMNSGQAYINECIANDVPIPPTINEMDVNGLNGWKSEGFIPQNQQFIVQSPAEVRTFSSAKGMCIALPRYNAGKTTVALDGVICLSKITSKVCIWDNQMAGATFSFPAGAKIPIGVPNLAIDALGRYQGGGAELTSPGGGICTDCHAGENPYIVHPEALLRVGFKMGQLGATLPMFGPDRYDPIVLPSWPQNALSHSPALVPAVCSGCHVKGGSGGRFPHLSNELPSYCGTILTGAVAGLVAPPAPATMPQFAPGTEAANPAVTTFRNWCGSAPTSGPADRGDPHLTTTNGINYDFQGAGEFVALRNSDTRFELQARQSPISTSFVPGANPYTGLASCVSLNTAVAVRVGDHRVSYQPAPARPERPEEMELRIDGKPVVLPAGGISLGAGNLIAKAASGGGIDVKLADGTRLLVTPNFWASEGYWYLDIEVLNTPAREGTMGHIAAGNWLPFAPSGASFGPAPGALADRHVLLNQKFADAWRVTVAGSLFDYAPGTSTATFTDRNWPPPPGAGACRATIGGRRPVQGMQPERARSLCRRIEDKAAYENCVFDMTATGNAGVVESYMKTLFLRANPGP